MRGSYLFERHASKCTGRGPLGRSVLKGGRMAAARKSRRGRVRRGRQNGRFLAKFRGGRLPIAIEPDETSRHRYSGMVTRWYRHLVRAPRLSLSLTLLSLSSSRPTALFLLFLSFSAAAAAVAAANARFASSTSRRQRALSTKAEEVYTQAS